MKKRELVVATITMSLLSCQTVSDRTSTEPGEIKGTYTNEKLRKDAMLGVYTHLSNGDCTKVDDVQPYIVERPAGEPGEMKWEERWVVYACGAIYDISMKFAEDGEGGAYYHSELNQ